MSGMQGILLALTIGVIFVNGWTDAPSAITTVVATGALRYRKAVRLAAVCNLLGVLAMSLLNASVAETILSVARFDPDRPEEAAAALCAAMLSIVLFAVAAWVFGIPTSESHALIAALTGAALRLGGAAAVEASAWGKALWGLAMSLFAGLGLGWMLTARFGPWLAGRSHRGLDKAQILSAGCMAFLHGAQDGQKFAATLVLVDLLSHGEAVGPIQVGRHWRELCLCAAVMALGTSVGGKRIVETVGEKMGTLSRAQGVCADLAGVLCLLAASLLGIPMSTTHTKTSAILGAGLSGGTGGLNLQIVGRMLLAWAVTFPACVGLGWLLTGVFRALR